MEPKSPIQPMFDVSDMIEQMQGRKLDPMEKSMIWLAYSMARVHAEIEAQAAAQTITSGPLSAEQKEVLQQEIEKCKSGATMIESMTTNPQQAQTQQTTQAACNAVSEQIARDNEAALKRKVTMDAGKPDPWHWFEFSRWIHPDKTMTIEIHDPTKQIPPGTTEIAFTAYPMGHALEKTKFVNAEVVANKLLDAIHIADQDKGEDPVGRLLRELESIAGNLRQPARRI